MAGSTVRTGPADRPGRPAPALAGIRGAGRRGRGWGGAGRPAPRHCDGGLAPPGWWAGLRPRPYRRPTASAVPAAAGGAAVRGWATPGATPPRPPQDGRGTRDDRPPRDGWGTRDDRPPRDGWGARDDRRPRDGWGVWAGPGDRSWPGGSRGLPAGCPDVLPARRPRCQQQLA